LLTVTISVGQVASPVNTPVLESKLTPTGSSPLVTVKRTGPVAFSTFGDTVEPASGANFPDGYDNAKDGGVVVVVGFGAGAL
jgi:hypothetical protein